MDNRYPAEPLNPNDDDDGTIVDNVDTLRQAVVGHRIVKAERREIARQDGWTTYGRTNAFVITLDNGKEVQLVDTNDCCAFTELEAFLLHPERVNHVIIGVGTTERYTRWHIYADLGDVLSLTVGWSCGNPFYYGYGFAIDVMDVAP
jgi:hypothetical protein